MRRRCSLQRLLSVVMLGALLSVGLSAQAESRLQRLVRRQCQAVTAAQSHSLDEYAWILNATDQQKKAASSDVLRQAINRYGLKRVAISNDFLQKHNTNYSCEIPMEKKEHEIFNQKASGRCWAFAADLVLETKLAAKGLEQGALSRSFINYHSLKDRALVVLAHTAKTGKAEGIQLVQEGGFYPWAMAIIKQYGIVPRSEMGSSWDSDSSALNLTRLQEIVTAGQRDMARLSGPDAEQKRVALFERYASDVVKLLDTTIGKPPEHFTVNGKEYTPQSYCRANFTSKDLDYVVLSHNPRNTWNRRYLTPGLVEGTEYNVSMDTIASAVKKTIAAGEAVWCATNMDGGNPHRCDEAAGSMDKSSGLLSVGAFNYQGIAAKGLAPNPKLRKYDRYGAGICTPNHAVCITAYDAAAGNDVRKWKIDNSWGTRAGDQGHYHMYDDYFRSYVEGVVVPRWAVDQAVLQQAEAKEVLRPSRMRPKK